MDTDLFDVQEVLGLKRDCHTLNWDIIVGARVIAHICPHGKGHWLGLWQETGRE